MSSSGLHLSNCLARAGGTCTCGANSVRAERDVRLTRLLAESENDRARLRKALEAVEWVEERSLDPASVFEECPYCAASKENGHKRGCLVALALGRAISLPKVSGVDLGDRHNNMGDRP